jgi:hypothetical protein
MKQQTLAMAADQSGYEQYRKPTRRDEFLATMDSIVPWSALCEVIEPHYPKAGNGRPPIGLERMLRIHFNQHWFKLADLACEEALYGVIVFSARIDTVAAEIRRKINNLQKGINWITRSLESP